MLHRTVLPPSESLDHALTEVVRLLPKRAKLERYKPNRQEMYILRRETLPDLSGFVPLLDEIDIKDYEDLPAQPNVLLQPLFPEIGRHHYVSFAFAVGAYHGTKLGWRKKNGKTSLHIYIDHNSKEPVKAFDEIFRCLGLAEQIHVDTSRPEGYQIVSSTLSIDCGSAQHLPEGILFNPWTVTIDGLSDIAERLRDAPFANDQGTCHRCVWCSTAEYATLFAQRRHEPGPWTVSLYAQVSKGAVQPSVMPIATCYLPKEQVVEVEFDATTKQATIYSVFPLNPPTTNGDPVLAGGCSPLDPFIADWSFLQQVWQQKPDMESLIHAIRTDDRCEPLDEDRWEPEPKAQVAASDIADKLTEKLEPVLAGRLTTLSNTIWAGGVHDLCPELLPEPCLAMSLSPERVAQIAFPLNAADKSAVKQAFAQIEIDEEWWLGNAKDFLTYLTTWLKLLSRAKKKGQGVVVIFYG
jgi:hypothetical protein